MKLPAYHGKHGEDPERVATSRSVDPATLAWPDPKDPVWDVYIQEDGHAAVCLGGTRTYDQARLAADSHNAR